MADTKAILYGTVTHKSDSPCTGIFTKLGPTVPQGDFTGRLNFLSIERQVLENGIYRITIEKVGDE